MNLARARRLSGVALLRHGVRATTPDRHVEADGAGSTERRQAVDVRFPGP